MECIIGIDIGGSTTKIVGFVGGALIGTLKVKASDQLTSAYGAFGRFLTQYGLKLDDINRVMLTGAGASFVNEGFYGLPTTRVGEFQAIGRGGKFLSGFDRAIIVSMGTGTAFIRVSGGEIKHLGGSGVGGGTLLGLANRMIGVREFDSVIELAKRGDLSHVDLTVGDISRDPILNMPPETTASNFGALSDLASPEDIALGIVNVVFQTAGMLAIFAAHGDGINDIVLTGNLALVPAAEGVLDALERLHGVKFLIPENAEFATAIGAALS